MFVKWLFSYNQIIDCFFTCLDLNVVSFHLNYYSWYVCSYFYDKGFLGLIVKQLLCYIQIIEWIIFLIICMLFHFIWIIVASKFDSVFRRIDCLLSFWNDYYILFILLIESYIASICMLFRFIQIIVAGIYVAVLTRSNWFYVWEMIIILYPVHWLIHYYTLQD